MKNKKAEQNWWSALSNWLVKYQGRADYLFIYDGKHGRLDRCFDRNVSLHSVDEATVSKLYQAAAEGRLGLLRPKDLKPQLLTTDPAKMFSSGKEVYVEQNRPQQAETEEEAAENAANAPEEKRPEQAAAEPAAPNRLQETEAGYRQVVQGLQKPAAPALTGNPGGKKAPAEISGDGKNAAIGVAEQAAKSLRNAAAAEQDAESNREIARLAEELVQQMLSASEAERMDAELLERKRKEREKRIAAQDIFIWSSVSEKRDREEYEAQMEWLEQRGRQFIEQEILHKEWMRQMTNMSRELYDMAKAGASEQDCKEKIRDYLDGKIPSPQPRKEGAEAQQEEPEISAEMWGNTLRQFCRFAASEVPLSIKHVKVAEHCRKIMQQVKEMGFSMDELGLDPQEQSVVSGTIEMGNLVEQGLMAQAVLTSGEKLPHARYRMCLQCYLAMKGIEEALVPHVQAHQKEIDTGDGPVSALQVLMGNRGFHAADLRAKAGRSDVLTRLERMNPMRVSQMIKQGGSELSEMGRQVMIASCQVENTSQPVREPKAPLKGGPGR